MMTTHGHKHAHESTAGEHPRPKFYLSGLHRDWRTWLVLAIMLAAIGTYVLTLDDAIQPGGAVQGGLPAAAAPAGPAK
jgi:hypothetical protein